jgi:hypothetical protein
LAAIGVGETAWAGIFACPRWGGNSYFVGGVLVVLVELVVFLELFEVFLAFFVGAVLFWVGVAGVVFCAKITGRLAAAKTIASKLLFILISP